MLTNVILLDSSRIVDQPHVVDRQPLGGQYHSQNRGEGIEDGMDEYRRQKTTASVSEFPRKEPEHEGRPAVIGFTSRWINPNKRATIIAA